MDFLSQRGLRGFLFRIHQSSSWGLFVHLVSCTQKKELLKCINEQNQELVCPLCTGLCYCPAPATKTDGWRSARPRHSDHLCLPQDCQTSFTWDSIRQPHPIPDIPTPAISLFSLKPSTLFKIKGRNHIFSSVFSLPPERASRAHLWDRAITSPKVWTKMETFRAYLWMWSCFQNIPVFTTSLKEDCNLIHHPETVQNDTAILLIPAGQSVKSTRASSASSLPVHQFLRCTIAHEKFEYLFNFQTWQWKNLLPLSPLHHLHGFWEEATN